MAQPARIAVIAVGGNALIADRRHVSIPDQSHAAEVTARHIADAVAAGWRVAVTHGSGPQVGFVLRRSELARAEVPPEPLDAADADVQGGVGYMFQRALHNEFHRRAMAKRAVAVVTQVLVERADPAFAHPDKPVGAYMDAATAARRARALGWAVAEDAGRGWRRVVPSPLPKAIVDLAPIRDLLGAGYTVIGCGGGGIPVVADEAGMLSGVEAVIDKDHASGLLAAELGAEVLLVATSVAQAALHFGKPGQQWLGEITVAEARAYDREGHFAEGSMAPKVRALADFVAKTGGLGLITDPPNIGRALAGEAGTRIVPG